MAVGICWGSGEERFVWALMVRVVGSCRVPLCRFCWLGRFVGASGVGVDDIGIVAGEQIAAGLEAVADTWLEVDLALGSGVAGRPIVAVGVGVAVAVSNRTSVAASVAVGIAATADIAAGGLAAAEPIAAANMDWWVAVVSLRGTWTRDVERG